MKVKSASWKFMQSSMGYWPGGAWIPKLRGRWCPRQDNSLGAGRGVADCTVCALSHLSTLAPPEMSYLVPVRIRTSSLLYSILLILVDIVVLVLVWSSLPSKTRFATSWPIHSCARRPCPKRRTAFSAFAFQFLQLSSCSASLIARPSRRFGFSLPCTLEISTTKWL